MVKNDYITQSINMKHKQNMKTFYNNVTYDKTME